jgi:hypothetical protein
MFISAVLSSLKVLRVRSPEEITNPRRISSSVHHIYSMENFRLRYLTSVRLRTKVGGEKKAESRLFHSLKFDSRALSWYI